MMDFKTAIRYMKHGERVQSCVSGTNFAIIDGELRAENVVVPSSFMEAEEMKGEWKVVRVAALSHKKTIHLTMKIGGDYCNGARL